MGCGHLAQGTVAQSRIIAWLLFKIARNYKLAPRRRCEFYGERWIEPVNAAK
jgi:hypothetical protein